MNSIHIHSIKKIAFLGDSLGRLRDFPEDARSEAGYQLREVQSGNDPSDWKPMKTIGAGVREIRIREASLGEQVIVLHAFQKKTQQTPQKNIDLVANRLRLWKGQRDDY